MLGGVQGGEQVVVLSAVEDVALCGGGVVALGLGHGGVVVGVFYGGACLGGVGAVVYRVLDLFVLFC